MKKSSIIVLAILVAIVGAIAWTLANNKEEINQNSEIKTIQNEIAVTVASAEIKDVSNNLELLGVALPVKSVVVASESTGKITEENIRVGEPVSKGMVLAKVNDTNQKLALENAQLNYDKYEDDLERYTVLREGEAVSETQLRDIQMGYDNATIQLEQAKKQLDDTKIIAPFSGVVTSRKTELGAFVNVGTPISEIADISQLKITLSVSEADVYELTKGQAVEVTTNVYPGVIYEGTITSISPQGSDSHTYPVEVIISNSNENSLKAGTYVTVSISQEHGQKVLMIPRDAIVSSVKDPSVYVVKGNKVELEKILTGKNHNNYLEVISGINVGDQVVTSGQINLTDGASVTIK